MTIREGYPPNIKDIREVFGIKVIEENKAIFAYGKYIYNPNKGLEIADHVSIHESVHRAQQEEIGGEEIWWKKYLEDIDFRFEQELEAYAYQYRYIKVQARYLNQQKKKFLTSLAEQLSGPLYGNLIKLAEAESKIRNKAKHIEV